jgi:hypothetical protein
MRPDPALASNQFDNDVDRRDYTAIVVRSLQRAPRLPPWPRGTVRRRSQASDGFASYDE